MHYFMVPQPRKCYFLHVTQCINFKKILSWAFPKASSIFSARFSDFVKFRHLQGQENYFVIF